MERVEDVFPGCGSYDFQSWSHLKGAVAEFVHPGQTVVFESSEHQGSLLRLHAERRHVLLQEAHTALKTSSSKSFFSSQYSAFNDDMSND